MTLQYVQIFVDFYMLMLSSPLRRFPRVQSERIFIGTVCLLSLNIVSLFQSSLATVFIKPMYYRSIDSLEQLAETRQRILIKYPAMLADLFPEDSSTLSRTLHDRMILVPRPELTAVDVVDNMKMATVTRRSSSRLNSDMSHVHMIPECPNSYNLAFVMARHSVYLDRVNAIILDINQFGFINKWIDEITFKVKLDSMLHNSEVVIHARVLTVNDMQLAFAILIFGAGAGFVLLIAEKLWFRRIEEPKSGVKFVFVN